LYICNDLYFVGVYLLTTFFPIVEALLRQNITPDFTPSYFRRFYGVIYGVFRLLCFRISVATDKVSLCLNLGSYLDPRTLSPYWTYFFPISASLFENPEGEPVVPYGAGKDTP